MLANTVYSSTTVKDPQCKKNMDGIDLDREQKRVPFYCKTLAALRQAVVWWRG